MHGAAKKQPPHGGRLLTIEDEKVEDLTQRRATKTIIVATLQVGGLCREFSANFPPCAPALFIRAFLFDWGSLDGVMAFLRALPSRASFDRRAGRMSNSAPARAGALLRDAVRVLSISQSMR